MKKEKAIFCLFFFTIRTDLLITVSIDATREIVRECFGYVIYIYSIISVNIF